MHDLAVNKYLISAHSIAHRIRWVRSRRYLDLAPLAIGRYKLSLGCQVLELFEDALILNTALSLDKWRF